MLLVLGLAVLGAWLVRASVDAARPALRLLMAALSVSLLLGPPVHVAAAANLAFDIPVRAATILVAQLPLVAAALMVWRRTRGTAEAGRAARAARPRVPILAATALVSLAYLIFAVDAFAAFPAGWDGVIYHLPMALRWLQEESLALPRSLAWPYSLPGNGEILMMLGLGTRVEQAAIAVNLAAPLLIGPAVFLIARRLDAHRDAALVCALIAVSTPIVVYQAFLAYVDAYAASLTLAGVVLLLYRDEPFWHAGRRAPRLADLLAGAAFGLAWGAKITTLVPIGLAGIALVLVLVRTRGWKPALHAAGMAAAGFLLTAAFWLVRAWSETGNPFFPIALSVGDVVILEGVAPGDITPEDYGETFVRSPAEWLVYPWTEWHRSGFSFGTGQGVGAAFATFVPLGVLYAAYRAARGERRSLTAVLLGGAAIAALVWWFAMHRVPRFALPMLLLSCALAAPLLSRLRERSPRAMELLALVTIATTTAMLVVEPALRVAGYLRDGRPTRAEFYGLPAAVESLPPGARILNLSDRRNNYPLAGACLCNRVLPDFTASWWLARLGRAADGPDYVVASADTLPYLAPILRRGGFRPLAEARAHDDEQRLAVWRRGPPRAPRFRAPGRAAP